MGQPPGGCPTRRRISLRTITADATMVLVTTPTPDPEDPPPPWLHEQIMEALAPHLERLREITELEKMFADDEAEPPHG
ncbi:hypothetical protein GCM10010156_66340 [Planobispora rosea]|uniref:Uncharacterized protein n=1 Tax=Planobispora rosea TaxID=35762 RepID=A0A8J3S678_PLARO|nr:hypothetical protein [Planobispora rosea]GGS98944.1 hypothetical protein GCM10010156_66340 [Planobispora rosea]GIH87998.1 hypothetical protein Pro02_64060 [Planobispora rosea]